MDFLRELYLFMKCRKKYWLLPLLIFLLLLGVLVIASLGTAVPPFIYTLF